MENNKKKIIKKIIKNILINEQQALPEKSKQAFKNLWPYLFIGGSMGLGTFIGRKMNNSQQPVQPKKPMLPLYAMGGAASVLGPYLIYQYIKNKEKDQNKKNKSEENDFFQ